MANLIPFNKRNPISRIGGFEELYGFLDDFFNEAGTVGALKGQAFKIDIEEKDDKYVVEAEVPGVKKEEIKINIDEGRLTIGIEREEKKEEEGKNYLHRERTYSSTSRCVYLGDLDEDKINAKLEEGVLKIELPKREAKDKTKQISIE